MKHRFQSSRAICLSTLEDARAIAEEAWLGYVEMKKDWIGEAETSEFVKLFESFQLLVPDFFPLSQSCKTERETCGKDCVSAVYALSMNRVYIYIIYVYIIFSCNHTFVCEYIMTYFPFVVPAFW